MLKVPFLDRSQLRGKLPDQETEYATYILSLGIMDLHGGLCEMQKEEQYHWVRQQLKKGLYWPA